MSSISRQSDNRRTYSCEETYERIDLYVRSDGSNLNPGTIDLPLATPIEAEKRLPHKINHVAIIHLGTPPIGQNYWDMSPFKQRIKQPGCHIIIIGDGAGESGEDGFTEVVSSTAALAGSGTDRIISAGLSTTEHYGYGENLGYTIEILSGSAIGDRKTIRENTITDIYPIVSFSAAVSEGDLYRIVRPKIGVSFSNLTNVHPASTGEYSNIDKWFHGNNINTMGAFVLINLRFTDSELLTYRFLSFVNEHVIILGCESDCGLSISGSGIIKLGYETINWAGYIGDSSNEGVPLGRDIFNTPSSLSWNGWTLSMPENNVNSNLVNQGTYEKSNIYILGTIACCSLLTSSGYYRIEGGIVWRGINSSEHDDHSVDLYLCADSQILKVGSLTSPVPAYRACNGKHKIYSLGQMVRLYGNTRVIKVYRNAKMWIQDWSGGDVILTLANANGVALLVEQNGEIEIVGWLPSVPTGHGFTVNSGRTYHPVSDLTIGSHFEDSLYGRIYHTGDL